MLLFGVALFGVTTVNGNFSHVREEILFRLEHLVQIFHDCVAVAAEVNRLETKFAEIDYHAKLRDMCCETIIAFSKEKNSTLEQIVTNQRQTLLPVFVEYVEYNDSAIQVSFSGEF